MGKAWDGLRKFAAATSEFLDTCRTSVFVDSHPFRWLYGFDKDATIRRNAQRDGTSLFTVLATFALAQGAALTQLAKDEFESLAIGIYAGAVVLTICWIVALLRSDEKSAQNRAPQRTYEKPTIRYGRWVLSWVLLEGIVLLILAWNQLLPNQTHRVFHEGGKIDVRVGVAQDRMDQAISERQKSMDKWIGWFDKEFASEWYEFFWIEQEVPFDRDYYSFVADLECNVALCEMGQKTAFLLSNESSNYRPTYRQIPFDVNQPTTNTARLVVEDPDKGSRIVILVYAKLKNQVELPVDQGQPKQYKKPTPEECNFRLTQPRGS